MGASFGGTVKLTGESEYRKALKEITSNLKLVSSELKLTNTQFASGDNTLKQTRASYNSMKTTLDEQKEKVSNLRKALKEAETEYGSNNEKVKQFKTQLNNAENQLKQMEDATDKSNKELKSMKSGFDEAGSGALKFGDILKANVLGDMITSGLKAVGTAIKEIGKSFIDIGKQSLNSYADYEQLAGGVETLFKDNADTVKNYANNAYKTAGLSANEYMETVTSFSASLLQSLNGDTAKSANVADMAITDMADNANKMGTSMESIQNAYQGFAKQNYTMLDNLKLGYGGTKSEMERLLSDAQKVTGIKYDINNLNDVYQAIHIIQGELDITGTTAKEANTTIQGSVATMKSSWTNLLTAFISSDMSLEDEINNFVNTVLTVGDNILPKIGIIVDSIIQVLPQIVERINENLPSILNSGVQILNTLLEGIITNLPAIMESANQIINTLSTTLLQLLPQIIEGGIQIIVSLVQGLAQQLPMLIPQMVETIITIVDSLLDNIDMIIDTGIQLLIGLAEGLINALPQLIDKIPVIIDKLINAIINNLPKIIETGITLIIKLAEGLIKAIPQLISKIPQIISSLVNGFKNHLSNMGEIGKNIVEGIWNGIKNAKDWLLKKVKEWCGNIVSGIKSFFGIHSPSTLFRDEVGKFMAQGVGVGFEKEMKDVTEQMQTAIPTEFDTGVNIKQEYISQLSKDIYNQETLTNAFISALKTVRMELDDEVVGKFVVKTITKEVYA